jgi:hypothetical protein
MMNSVRIKKLLILIFGGAAVASCTPIKTRFSDIGKLTPVNAVAQFDNSSLCADTKAESSIVADEDGNAFLTRSGCQNLEEAQPINPQELQSSESGEEVLFRNEIFELNSEASGQMAQRSEGEQPRANEEIPRAGNEVPRVNTEVPRVNTEVPRVNTEIPRVNTEIPRVNTEIPHVNTEVPRVNTEVPRVNTEVPHVNMETPSPNTETPSINIETPSSSSERI